MKIFNSEKGFALVTVLLFGMVAFGVVIGAYYMVVSGTRMSGIEKRYMSELDIAKGTSEFVMGRLVANNLRCNGGNTCTGDPTCAAASSAIDISSAICTVLGKQTTPNGCVGLTACYMSITTMTEIDPVTLGTNIIDLVAVNVTSANTGSGENADIDFVLRVQ